MDIYTLKYDAPTNTIEAAFARGQWTVAQARQWKKDMDGLVATLQPGFSVLVDMTESAAQSQDVKKVHDESMKVVIEHGVRRVAIIVASTVLAMQMKRSVETAGGGSLFEFVTSRQAATQALAA